MDCFWAVSRISEILEGESSSYTMKTLNELTLYVD
jgi:hypothetical protein